MLNEMQTIKIIRDNKEPIQYPYGNYVYLMDNFAAELVRIPDKLDLEISQMLWYNLAMPSHFNYIKNPDETINQLKIVDKIKSKVYKVDKGQRLSYSDIVKLFCRENAMSEVFFNKSV
jgi:hypothetical protein